MGPGAQTRLGEVDCAAHLSAKVDSGESSLPHMRKGCDLLTRQIEVRVPGADIVPHYALSALIALGLRGIERKLAFPMPPLNAVSETAPPARRRLAKDLKEATTLFMAPDSLAREVLGDAFVDHFGMTRLHEIRLWEQVVTEWEVSRYLEVV